MTDRKLETWGEICAYLGGVDRKTVLRRGYPVHYYLATGRVYAFASELAAHDRSGGEIPTNAHVCPQTPILESA
jgi:hypothetical protein